MTELNNVLESIRWCYECDNPTTDVEFSTTHLCCRSCAKDLYGCSNPGQCEEEGGGDDDITF